MNQEATETRTPSSGTPPGGSEIQAWRKLATLCLEAVAKHPVQFSTAEGAAFTGRIQESMEGLVRDAGASQILVTAGSIAEAVDRYSTQTQQRFDGLIAQFRTLAKALGERSPGSRDLQAELEKVLAAKEWPELETLLPGCVEAAQAVGASSAGGLDGMGAGRPVANGMNTGNGSNAGAPDPCTGLPTKSDAEAAIRKAIAGEAQGYVATFYLHRMNLINARFGDAIGNQVILFCSQHIATYLTGANDSLFRWRGPGFMALLERSDSPLAVASEVQRFTSMPLSRFFETPSRTVYLPIKLTGEVLALPGKSFDDVLNYVQQSLHTHGETGD